MGSIELIGEKNVDAILDLFEADNRFIKKSLFLRLRKDDENISPEVPFCSLFNVRWTLDIVDFQIVINVLTLNRYLKIEYFSSLLRNRRIGHHRDEIVGVFSGPAEALVVTVITQHADSFAAALIMQRMF